MEVSRSVLNSFESNKHWNDFNAECIAAPLPIRPRRQIAKNLGGVTMSIAEGESPLYQATFRAGDVLDPNAFNAGATFLLREETCVRLPEGMDNDGVFLVENIDNIVDHVDSAWTPILPMSTAIKYLGVGTTAFGVDTFRGLYRSTVQIGMTSGKRAEGGLYMQDANQIGIAATDTEGLYNIYLPTTTVRLATPFELGVVYKDDEADRSDSYRRYNIAHVIDFGEDTPEKKRDPRTLFASIFGQAKTALE